MKNIQVSTIKSKNAKEYLRHEYPKNGKFHPFDITSDLQYFIFADGFSYLMNEYQTKQTINIKKVIPKAYMPYYICKRGFMIYKGNIVWKNTKDDLNDTYAILSLYKDKISEKNYSHNHQISNNLDNDIETIKKLSKKNENIYMFVSIIS